MSSSALEGLPIIQTKLNRPSIPVDLVPRPQLTDWLDKRRNRSLTLISAPAGYGKTTLISSWLDSYKYPSVWLTLDEHDNDLVVFLTYMVAAIQSIFPQAANNTQVLLRAPNLPPIDELAVNLSNDIELIGEYFVLVLDDYGLIRENAIQDFINTFLSIAPSNMNLVICTRVDPPVSLVNLRENGKMSEIRAQDLRFSAVETYELLQKMLGTKVDIHKAKQLEDQTEGWVTGLRLTALALRHRLGKGHFDQHATANNYYVTEYFMSEILDSQATGLAECLIKTSILERFNADLCDMLCSCKSGMNGKTFVDWLQKSNLFTIFLDDQRHWMRYHQIFNEFLHTELERRYGKAEIAALHVKASEWYANNGFIEEAIHHALAAGNVSAAADLVEQNAIALLNESQWYLLGKLLAQLPDNIIQQRPELLIAKAWVLFENFTLAAIPPILDTVANLVGDEEDVQPILGEVDFFWGHHLYWQGQSKSSVKFLSCALERIPKSNYMARGETELLWSLAAQMSGLKKEAVQELNRWLNDEDHQHFGRLNNLLGALIFIHIISGDLKDAYQLIPQVQNLAVQHGNKSIETWTFYLYGLVYFFWNDMENAATHFAQAVDHRYLLHTRAAIDSLAGLALSQQALGKMDNARATMELLLKFAQETNNPSHLRVARSTLARLSHLKGDMTSAIRWLETADLPNEVGVMFYWLEVPHITQCRVLIAQGTPRNLQEAVEKLQYYRQANESQHNTCQLIHILALLAVAYDKQQKSSEAQTALRNAISLAEPGNWIRSFVELGEPMAKLLVDFIEQRGKGIGFPQTLLDAFPEEIRNSAMLPYTPWMDLSGFGNLPYRSNGLTELLTNREIDVLKLLAKQYSNKEIAERLVISPGTVRLHSHNIYKKMGVNGRQQAIVKAIKLGLIPS